MSLLDPFERDHAVESMREWVTHPAHHPPEICAATVKRLIIEPVGHWLESEWARVEGNPKNYAHIEAAQAFLIAAMDIEGRFQRRLPVYEEHISLLETSWRELQVQIGWGAVWRDGEYKASQRRKAHKKRSQTPELVAAVVKRHPQSMTPGELWPHFIALLEQEGYDPEEKPNRREPKKTKVIFFIDAKEKGCTFGHFGDLIKEERKNKP